MTCTLEGKGRLFYSKVVYSDKFGTDEETYSTFKKAL
jgi:hypothetical protein